MLLKIHKTFNISYTLHRIPDRQSRFMTKVHDLLGQPSYIFKFFFKIYSFSWIILFQVNCLKISAAFCWYLSLEPVVSMLVNATDIENPVIVQFLHFLHVVQFPIVLRHSVIISMINLMSANLCENNDKIRKLNKVNDQLYFVYLDKPV